MALCKRTLYIAEKINETHGNKIHFILAKADESGSDLDRQVSRFIIYFVIIFFQFNFNTESFNANRSGISKKAKILSYIYI